MNKCLFCGKDVTNKFCNNSCSAKFNNAKRPPRSEESKNKTRISLTGHLVSSETKNKISEKHKGRKNTWLIDVKVSEETKEKIRKKMTGKKHSVETKEKLRKAAKAREFGGHTSKKRMTFIKRDGEIVHLQSSYEIRFATLLEQLNISWSRPTPLLWIDDKGIVHRYYADFKVGNVYIDTKNDYLAIKDLPKINAVRDQNNIDIRIVTLNMINAEFIGTLI